MAGSDRRASYLGARRHAHAVRAGSARDGLRQLSSARASTRLRGFGAAVRTWLREFSRLLLLRVRPRASRRTRQGRAQRTAQGRRSRAFAPDTDALLARRGLPELQAIERRHRGPSTSTAVAGDALAAAWDAAWAADRPSVARSTSSRSGARTRSSEDLRTCTSRSCRDRRPRARRSALIQGGHTTPPGGRGRDRAARRPRAGAAGRRAIGCGDLAAADDRRARAAGGWRGLRRGAAAVPRRARPPRPDLRRPRGAILGGGAGASCSGARAAAEAPDRASCGRVWQRLQGDAAALADEARARAGRRARAARPVRGPARPRQRDRPADRGPQLLDRPDGPRRGSGRSASASGRRLVREGSIGAEDDVLYLHRDEVAEAIRRPGDRRALVAERRAEHARQRDAEAAARARQAAEGGRGLTAASTPPARPGVGQ